MPCVLIFAYFFYSPMGVQVQRQENQNDHIQVHERKKYRDVQLGFEITYPYYLTPLKPDIDRKLVTFVEESGYGEISVEVATTPFATPEEWVAAENEKGLTTLSTHQYRIEQERTIDGVHALVVHIYTDSPGGHEEYTHEKTALIIKDTFLYHVNTRATDHEVVWNSFRFLK